MFKQSKINEPIEPRAGANPAPQKTDRAPQQLPDRPATSGRPAQSGRPNAPSAPSVIAPDLRVVGNLITDGDLQIEGTVEGDIHASTLIVGQGAQVKGEIRSNDVTVNGRITGRIRGRKVRLTETAQVDGDVVHASISIESGAHFEGSIHRAEDPLKDEATQPRVTELPKAGDVAS